MNNVFVYIELENGVPADVSLELLTKGRELATTLGVKLEAVVLGHNLGDIAKELAKYGADTVWTADDKEFAPFRTLPHTAVMCGLIEQEKPQIALFGATSIGRDFAPRVSSALFSGLTADCTQLVIGDHKDAKTGTEYKNLLYQIRPAFGGNIIATIVNPDHRPQMATVREGVMRKEYAATPGAGEVKPIDWKKFLKESDLVVKILDRQIEERKINIKGASVVVAGGYGVGSKENFKLIHELAEVLGGEAADYQEKLSQESTTFVYLKRQADALRTLGKAKGKFQFCSFRYLVHGQDFRIHTGRLYCKPLLGHLPTAVHWLPSHVIAHRKRLAQGRNRLYGQGSILTLPQLVDDHAAAPVPGVVIVAGVLVRIESPGILGLAGVPAIQVAMDAIRASLGCIECARVEGIHLRTNPRATR